MDNKTPGSGGNPYGGKDYFGLNDIEGLKFEPEQTAEIFAPENGESRKTYVDFSSKSARSINIGPINTPDSSSPAMPYGRKKFEVHFSDTEDLSGDGRETEQRPKNRGAIYFSNRSSAKPSRSAAESRGASRPSSGGAAHSNSSAAPAPARKKPPKSKNGLSLPKNFPFVFSAVVAVCAVIISVFVISCINDIFALNRSDETVSITIPTDATSDEIIDILSDNDLIHQKLFCKLFYNLTNIIFDEDPDEIVFLSGVYYVKSNLGLEGYMMEFQETQVAAETVNLFFPEGWTIYQMFDKIESFGVCGKSQLIAALEGADFDFDFIDALPSSSNRVFTLEGYFFPDTYEFYETSDANSIIRKFLSNFENRWEDEYTERCKELNMTMDEVIILASIIQREAADEEQMPMVSSVIHNRLDHSVSYPTLGCDATINYINTYVKPNVTNVEATLFANAYDTSAIQGLPAGPVCNPGLAAIEAALYPADTDYYYFCHDKTGKIYLARTNAEHDANALKVLRANN